MRVTSVHILFEESPKINQAMAAVKIWELFFFLSFLGWSGTKSTVTEITTGLLY
jgi:hypothetical protein